MDSLGRIWVAKWGGWCVECYDLNATNQSSPIVCTYELPVEQVTACAFGGPDLDQLYVTTASCGLSDAAKREQPLAGSLFVINLANIARGVKAVPFAG